MDNTTKQFFELLKSGLWGTPADAKCFESDVDWLRLYNMAEKQTVVAICFDGIETLPKSCMPDIDTLMEWLGQVNLIELSNKHLDNGIVEVVSRYNSIGLKPILLKGQGIGQYYRNPKHRCPGDIDLYFADGIESANSMTATWNGVVFEEDTESHTGFRWQELSVENHHKYVKFVSQRNKNIWENIEREIGLIGSESLTLKKDKICFNVPVPQPQINVLYVFIHLMHHLLQIGVGLRQVCDWLCLWKACENNIDKDMFLKHVEMLPVKRCMTALTWIAVNFMGMEKGIIPLDTDTDQAHKDGVLLLNDILETGNFGHDTEIWKGFKRNQHINNIKSYYLAARRMMKIHRLCPSELNAYPWHWLKSKVSGV